MERRSPRMDICTKLPWGLDANLRFSFISVMGTVSWGGSNLHKARPRGSPARVIGIGEHLWMDDCMARSPHTKARRCSGITR